MLLIKYVNIFHHDNIILLESGTFVLVSSMNLDQSTISNFSFSLKLWMKLFKSVRECCQSASNVTTNWVFPYLFRYSKAVLSAAHHHLFCKWLRRVILFQNFSKRTLELSVLPSLTIRMFPWLESIISCITHSRTLASL